MYAHQVIEDLKGLKLNISDDKYTDTIKHLITGISQAQKFHMGRYDNMRKLFDMKSKPLFLHKDVSNDVRLPYKECWFDSVHQFEKTTENSENINVSKRGMYVIEFKKDLIGVTICNYINAKELGKPKWMPAFQSYLIRIGKILDKNIFPYTGPETNVLPVATSDVYYKKAQKDETLIHRSSQDDSEDLYLLNMFLMMINCKNIGTETTPAPVKLNNKRKKAGKLPIFSYKTLILKPFGKKQKAMAAKGLWHNRIHLAMGHWKTYTKERPMFGKYSGRFWVPAHVRGQNRDGIVMKDYEVKAS